VNDFTKILLAQFCFYISKTFRIIRAHSNNIWWMHKTRQHTHTNTNSSSSLFCAWLELASSNTRHQYCQQ